MRSGLPFKRRARQQIVGSGGFTITESLIFLAVSSALLISALSLFNGSQNRTQFSQAMDDANQQINTIINNVANGYYPRINQVTCDHTTSPAVSVGEPIAGDAEAGRGAQKGCMFIGRVAQFNLTKDVFRVYSVVGARQITVATGDREVENFTDAKPAPIQTFDEIKLKNGIELKTMRIPGGSNKGLVGFFTSFGKYDTPIAGVPQAKLLSGALSTDFVLFPSSSLDDNDDTADGLAEVRGGLTNLKTTYVTEKNPAQGVELCFNSGTGGQHGIITIGGLNATTATTMTINYGDCPA